MTDKIQNPQLEELDKEIVEFNRLFTYYTNMSGNLYASNEIKKDLEQLAKTADKIIPASEFDFLVLDHIKHVIEGHYRIAKFFGDVQNTQTESISSLVDFCLGDNFFLELENFIKQRQDYWKDFWEQVCSFNERGLHILRSDSPEADAEITKIIPTIKQDVIQEGIKRGFIPQGYDFQLVKYPPCVDIRPSWNSSQLRMDLGNSSFECLNENGKIRINPTNAYSTLFHEILGHAAHQHNSQNMPLSLRMFKYNNNQFVAGPHTEGIADDRTTLVVEYLRDNLDRLNIKPEELRSLELSVK